MTIPPKQGEVSEIFILSEGNNNNDDNNNNNKKCSDFPNVAMLVFPF